MKNYICVFLLAIQSLIFAENSSEQPKVYVATVPKAGTFLLIKALKLMNVDFYGKSGRYNEATWLQTGQAHLMHYIQSKEMEKLPEVFSSKNKYIVLYRDPRDFMISYLKWAALAKDRIILAEWRRVPFQDKISQAINETTPQRFNNFLAWKEHFDNFYIVQELKKRNWDHVLMIKFEDLIGPKGGGSLKKQTEVLREIAKFLNIEITKRSIKKLQKALWGGTFTFTEEKQKVGQWKAHFTSQHIADFNNKHHSLLLDLGYEQDGNRNN